MIARRGTRLPVGFVLAHLLPEPHRTRLPVQARQRRACRFVRSSGRACRRRGDGRLSEGQEIRTSQRVALQEKRSTDPAAPPCQRASTARWNTRYSCLDPCRAVLLDDTAATAKPRPSRKRRAFSCAPPADRTIEATWVAGVLRECFSQAECSNDPHQCRTGFDKSISRASCGCGWDAA